ncbi:MAG: hypothetical protein ACOC0U_00590, partial [Desulfovibrionales bacterium]
MNRIFLLSTLLVFLVSCAPKYSMGPEMDVNTYSYAVVNKSAYDQEIRPEIESLLAGLGFRVIEPGKASELNDENKAKTLTYAMQSFTTDQEARVRVKLLDYRSKAVVYSSEATHRFAGDQEESMLAAVQKSMEGLYQSYTDVNIAPEPVSDAPEEKEIREVASKDSETGEQDSVKKTADAEEDEWENISKSRKDLVKYFDKNYHKLDPIEGIWTDDKNEYTIAVFQDQVPAKRDFVGIVLSDTNSEWKTCDVLVEIKQTAHAGSYTATYYFPDRSEGGGTLEIENSGRLHGVFGKGGSDRKMNFLRNYPEHFAQADASRRRGPLSYGTGFVVDTSGYLVTNYHVV